MGMGISDKRRKCLNELLLLQFFSHSSMNLVGYRKIKGDNMHIKEKEEGLIVRLGKVKCGSWSFDAQWAFHVEKI